MTGHCATLQWVASDPAAGPPAVSYRAYSAVVGPPATAIWTVFDNTSTTNLVIVGNVYRMFRVTGISATGAESLPSNVVTNDFAVPGAPTNATIRASIEGAPTPGGPWAEATNMTMVVAMTPAAQFFRTRMAIAIP